MSHFRSPHYASPHYGSPHYGGITIVIVVQPRGGIDDAPLKARRFKRKTKKNVRHLLLLASMAVIVENTPYERRQDNETEPAD